MKFHTSMVSRPSWTAVNRSGNIVSRPGNPGGAFSPDFFSSTVCGATYTKANDNTHNIKLLLLLQVLNMLCLVDIQI